MIFRSFVCWWTSSGTKLQRNRYPLFSNGYCLLWTENKRKVQYVSKWPLWLNLVQNSEFLMRHYFSGQFFPRKCGYHKYRTFEALGFEANASFKYPKLAAILTKWVEKCLAHRWKTCSSAKSLNFIRIAKLFLGVLTQTKTWVVVEYQYPNKSSLQSLIYFSSLSLF